MLEEDFVEDGECGFDDEEVGELFEEEFVEEEFV